MKKTYFYPDVSCIYAIENLANGHRYIGSAKNFRKRLYVHMRGLRAGRHHSPYLQKAWDLYGPSSFMFRVVEECAEERLLRLEQVYLDWCRPEYNILQHAGSRLGIKNSTEMRRKLSAALTGRKWTAESLARRTASQTGLKRSPETCAKISAALKGKKRAPWLNEAHSQKMRGRKWSEARRLTHEMYGGWLKGRGWSANRRDAQK